MTVVEQVSYIIACPQGKRAVAKTKTIDSVEKISKAVGLVLLTALLSRMPPVLAQECGDTCVTIESQETPTEVQVFANVARLLEATLTVRAQLKGMTPVPSNPVTVCLNGIGRFPVATYRKDGSVWSYKYEYAWQKGLMDYNQNYQGQYVICAPPFPLGQRYRVNQGFFGKQSHNPGSGQEYAVDFSLPEGGVICAALPGIVIGVRDDSAVGGLNPRYKQCANYIAVKHPDGTYGEYVHLQTGGARVRLGQRVSVGTPLGLAGHTGYADAPHLHFGVYKVRSGEQKQSLPIYFQTSAGRWTPTVGAFLQNI